MSAANFHVQEHTIPTCHIREYARTLASDDQGDVLQLAIKQYTPRQRLRSAKKEITIIGAHANGFPKELYEPLWDDLYERLAKRNIHIHGIWIADVAHQGHSGVLNEEKLGNDPSWADHPRDLFLMVNHFRQHMKRPLIGIGHSMGGNNLVNLSIMHPRLFTTLVLIDPVIQRTPGAGNFSPAQASVKRRDLWPSRQAAAEKLKSSKFYQAWDPRVLDKWIQYGLRDLPTYIHPQASATATPAPAPNADPSSGTSFPADKPVTLTTTKHQEVLTFIRLNHPTPDNPNPGTEPNYLTHPDADPAHGPISPFYNPYLTSTFLQLPHLRPSVFYIFGDPAAGAHMSEPVLIADRMANTGVGVGGSGGANKGRVRCVSFAGIGHLIPMEVTGRTADAAVDWLGPEIERWRVMEDAERRAWAAVPRREKGVMSEEYVRVMTGDWHRDGVVKNAKL